MRGILVGLVVAVMGLGLAQGEVVTPQGLPTPFGPIWRKLAEEECRVVWAALKEEVKDIALKGLPEPRAVNCLYFDKQKNSLGWEMGNKTLDQVFSEGWERHKRSFEMLRQDSSRPRAVGGFTFQPTPRSFVAVFFGFSPLLFRPIYDMIYALERENDVVLVEPRF
jgi:hypothetical protein